MFKNMLLLTALASNCLAMQSHLPELEDDFVVVDKGNTHGDNFINDERHNPKMTQEIREALIEKGYHLLELIRQGIQLPEKIEIFKDAGCQYSTNMLFDKTPTAKGIWNFCARITEEGFSSALSSQKTSEHTIRRRAKLENLIAIVWALADHSSKIGQPFASGSFSVIDPNGALFNVFSDYALFSGNVNNLEELPVGAFNAFNPSGNVFAYNRHPDSPLISGSSHYHGLTEYQLGIDARFESNAYSLSILPYQTQHFLVGRVSTKTGLQKTFVKYEEHGTGDVWSSTVHAMNFTSSVLNREGKRSEKDIPKDIMDAFLPFGHWVAQSNINLATKSKVINSMLESRESLTAPESIGKKYDISSLVLLATLVLVQSPSEDETGKELAHSFLDKLDAVYHDGKLQLNVRPNLQKIFYRSGNEIVLNLEELIPEHKKSTF